MREIWCGSNTPVVGASSELLGQVGGKANARGWGRGTKRNFLWCQNLDQVGYTPRKANREKVDNHSVKDHVRTPS